MDKKLAVLRWRGGLSKMAAAKPPFIPDLHRCSGRVPAEPCPPSKHLECTAMCDGSKAQSIHSGNNSVKSRVLEGRALMVLLRSFKVPNW